MGDMVENSVGCHILTSDFNDFGEMRIGSTVLDSVEIFNCSQFDALKPAVKFMTANLGYS